jgi:uncharacterized protein DUF4244
VPWIGTGIAGSSMCTPATNASVHRLDAAEIAINRYLQPRTISREINKVMACPRGTQTPGRQVKLGKEVGMSQEKITAADPRLGSTAGGAEVVATSQSAVMAGELAAIDPGARPWRRNQRGMVTAEWAVGIIAAAGLAGVLIIVVTHGAVRDALLQFILHVVHFISGKI